MSFPQDFSGLAVLLCHAERWFCKLQKLFLVSVIWHRINSLFCSMYLINLAFYFCSKRHFDFFFFFFKSVSRKILWIFHANRFHMRLLLDIHLLCMAEQQSQTEFSNFLTGRIKLDIRVLEVDMNHLNN